MSQQLPRISVILRTYSEERWETLGRAIESLYTQTLSPYEIVLVVDHNPAVLKRAHVDLPGVVLVENLAERGSANAWNSGVAAAQGDLLAFIDDDAFAAPDWLEQLAAGYQDEDAIGVGGTIEPVWLSGRPRWFPEEFDWVVGCTYRGMPEAQAPVRNLIGCNMSFRRAAFEQVGPFREGIGHVGGRPIGGDETEFCIRLRQHSPASTLLYRPQAKVYHQVPESRANWQYFRSRCSLEGQSKALVSQFVGVRDGLSAERVYTFKTLPQGVMRGVAEVLTQGDGHGLARSAAIVSGLSFTTLSYLRAKAAQHIAKLYQRSPEQSVTSQGRIA